jgi:hypothetical protein
MTPYRSIGNIIPTEQGKGIIKKNYRIQRQGKIEIAHMKTTKKGGVHKNNRAQRRKMHINETTQKTEAQVTV